VSAERLAALRAAAEEAGVSALIVTAPPNLRYLSGFSGSAGALVVRSHDAVLVTDGRYAEQAAAEAGGAGIAVETAATVAEQRDLVAALVPEGAPVGFEAERVSWAEAERWAGAIGRSLVPTSGLVERLREVKDADEVDRMRRAARAVDAALAEVLGLLGDEPTEAAFAAELDAAIRRHGAAGNSFETIVAAGANGARPHARPSAHRIAPGELVVVDVGAVVDGYCSDMTRTFCAGSPSAEALHHHAVVTEAQAAGVAALGPGVATADVDAACRAVIDAAGWGERFTHGTGHGVGLEIHEAPRVSRDGTATLQAGHVVTVEPGVYFPSRGGVRVEDLLVVTGDGAEPLTMTPKALTPDAIAG
jgi:Xaa-Pro aminopeptidase